MNSKFIESISIFYKNHLSAGNVLYIGSFIGNVEGLIRVFAKNSVTYIHCAFSKCHVWALTYIVAQTNSFMNESKEKI